MSNARSWYMLTLLSFRFFFFKIYFVILLADRKSILCQFVLINSVLFVVVFGSFVCLDLAAAPETAGACCEERSWRTVEASRQSHLAQLCCLRVQDGHQCGRKVRQSLRVTHAHLRSKKLLCFSVSLLAFTTVPQRYTV